MSLYKRTKMRGNYTNVQEIFDMLRKNDICMGYDYFKCVNATADIFVHNNISNLPLERDMRIFYAFM